ncbi:MAG: 50S ribosomal protein L29 [Spirochaetes bacterium]|nr:50S ribosomal protein L29 [Spirochaetota bacterium]
MKKNELKEKNKEELILEKDKLIKDYKDLKYKKVIGVIENPLRLRTIKKDIARINTILHMNEIEQMKKEIESME